KYSLFFGSFGLCVVEGLRKGKFYPLSRLRKEVNTMNEPERTEWQIRCAFNGFCKRTLKNESINAHKELRKRQAHEINFSDLTPKEENQLYTCEDFFAEDKEEQTFFAAGKELSAKLIADAIHSLPEEKRRAVLLYYFFDMSDAEIAALYQIPRSTVQYRRTSSFELLKRYLEEHAYDYHDW
ncbi:RNA polymerase sigma factor, partial [Bacteroides heparinolyticus]|uniref:RNA polymerase sigma factor n=1 Tax=Prevotella heparinolytica TaxID=28113 RepID=UPI00359F70D6